MGGGAGGDCRCPTCRWTRSSGRSLSSTPRSNRRTPLPLVNLASGLYFRTEGDDRLLVGKSLSEDPVGFGFGWEENRFTEQLWPELAGFAPAFDRLRVVQRGWAGLYAVNTFRRQCHPGRVARARLGSISPTASQDTGLQQAPAVGRYLAELITGSHPALDLSVFGPPEAFRREVTRGERVDLVGYLTVTRIAVPSVSGLWSCLPASTHMTSPTSKVLSVSLPPSLYMRLILLSETTS